MLLTSSLRRWINYAPCSLRNLNIVLVSSQVDAVSFEPYQVRIQLERSGLAFLRLASDRLADRRQDRQTDRQTEKTNPREKKKKKLVAHAEQRRPLGSKPQMPYK